MEESAWLVFATLMMTSALVLTAAAVSLGAPLVVAAVRHLARNTAHHRKLTGDA